MAHQRISNPEFSKNNIPHIPFEGETNVLHILKIIIPLFVSFLCTRTDEVVRLVVALFNIIRSTVDDAFANTICKVDKI